MTMTDRKDALTELLAKVEAGDALPRDFRCLEVSMQDARYTEMPPAARLAYKGSLDAAKALHEAVLQGWHINLTLDFCSVFPDGNDGEQLAHTGQCNDNPARAWLIAILKALIAGENTNANDKGE
jgi:hypothetical protein